MEKENKMEFIEAVRKRPAMYVGSTSIRGFYHILRELVKDIFNATETSYFAFELLGKISGKFTFKNIRKTISDNSALTFHTLNDASYQGFELAVLNALSKSLEFGVFDKDNTELFRQTFEKGELIKGEIANKTFSAEKIEISFGLDDSIFEIPEPFNANFYFEEIRNLAYLHKGKTFAVIYPVADEICKAVFNFENGLKDRIEVEKLKGLGNTYFDTYFEKEFEDFSVETAFAFREYTVDEPFLISYVNEHYTHEEGTHVDGLLKGLTYGVMKYFQKHELTGKYKISEKGMRENLIAAIHVKMKKPQFSGCVRNKLASPEIVESLADYISELLFEKIETDPESTEKIIRKFKIFD